MTALRIIVWLVALASPLWSQAGDVAVVVNLKNPVTRMTVSDLRKVFAGEKRTWPGGVPVKLVIRAPGGHEREVVLRILQMSESEFKSYWIAQAYKGEGVEPVAMFSNGMQKEAVISVPGAIALIAAEDLKPGLKILKIEDKLPGEQGYPLH